MEFVYPATLNITERLKIFELWNNEYPEKLAYKTISELDEYLANLTDQMHILLVDKNRKIRGWYFDFLRDNEKWFAIIIDSQFQGNGFGTQLLNIAKEKEAELSGWVIDHNKYLKRNGEMYKSPLKFYLKNGFDELSTIRLESAKIAAVKIKWKKR